MCYSFFCVYDVFCSVISTEVERSLWENDHFLSGGFLDCTTFCSKWHGKRVCHLDRSGEISLGKRPLPIGGISRLHYVLLEMTRKKGVSSRPKWRDLFGKTTTSYQGDFSTSLSSARNDIKYNISFKITRQKHETVLVPCFCLQTMFKF